MKVLKGMDIFGEKPVFHINGNRETYKKTIIGAIISIMFFSLCLIFFAYFLVYSMFFDKSGSIVTYFQYNYDMNYTSFELGNELNLALFAVDSNLQPYYLDPKLFDVYIRVQKIKTDFTAEKQKVKTESFIIPSFFCKNSNNSVFLKSKHKLISEFNPLCFESKNFFIGGDVFEIGFTYYTELFIYYLGNITEYKYKLQNIGLVTGFNSPQIENVTNPKKFTEITQYINVSQSFNLMIQRVSFISYENIVPFSNPSYSEKFPIFTSVVSKSIYNNLQTKLLHFDFKIIDNVMNIRRRYDTFDLYLAKFTSVINIFMIIFTRIGNFISNKDFHVDYINKFINISKNESFRKKSNKIYDDKIHKFNISSRKFVFETFDLIKKRIIDTNQKYFKKENINISLFDFICNRKSKKFKDFLYYHAIIDSILTFENFINVITDMKRLKKLLFDENEEKVFDSYSINGYYNTYSLNSEKGNLHREIIEKVVNRDNNHKCFDLKKLILNDLNLVNG